MSTQSKAYSCCGLALCGRLEVDEPGPGLELWNGKYSCTLCYVNPTRFQQPDFNKRYKQKADKLAAEQKMSEVMLEGNDD